MPAPASAHAGRLSKDPNSAVMTARLSGGCCLPQVQLEQLTSSFQSMAKVLGQPKRKAQVLDTERDRHTRAAGMICQQVPQHDAGPEATLNPTMRMQVQLEQLTRSFQSMTEDPRQH